MSELGLIQVYTGSGKGKTTASLGLTLRASGHGFKVCMIQFMKQCADASELKAAKFIPGFKVVQVGRAGLVDLKNPEEQDYSLARSGWALAKKTIDSGDFDIVILDEINVAMACGLVDIARVVKFLTGEKRNVEVVLTGRYAPKEIIAIANLVTDLQEVKHPYQQGIDSRQGIDY